MTFDKIHFIGGVILKRENTLRIAIKDANGKILHIEGDREFYCDSPLQLALALVEVIKDMDQEIKRIRDV
jgi:hypothetical protein